MYASLRVRRSSTYAVHVQNYAVLGASCVRSAKVAPQRRQSGLRCTWASMPKPLPERSTRCRRGSQWLNKAPMSPMLAHERITGLRARIVSQPPPQSISTGHELFKGLCTRVCWPPVGLALGKAPQDGFGISYVVLSTGCPQQLHRLLPRNDPSDQGPASPSQCSIAPSALLRQYGHRCW